MLRSVTIFCLIPFCSWAQLNSASDEQNPILTPDGKELYFTVGHHPQNASGMRDLGDIWFSQLQDGKWSLPAIAKGLINNGGYNAVLGFSADGNEMYLYGHYSANGSLAGSQGISVSQRSASGWSQPRNEEVLYFRNNSIATGGYITPDKKVFIFSADSRMSHGNEDLYVSFYDNEKWTEPKNLSATINSKFQELTPWLSDDKKVLFFSTNAQGSHGSFDVYSAERLDETWTNWTTPQNLGSAVNSPGKELYYHSYPSKIFLTSTHNSDGYGDIIEFPSNQKIDIVSPVAQQTPVHTTEPDTTPVTLPPTVETGFVIHGKVFNAVSNTGIPAEIIFRSVTPVKVISEINGEYKVSLDPQANYTVRVEAKGFIGSFEKLNIPGQDVHEVEVNFKLQPVSVGAGMNLKSVLFRQSTPILLQESYDELEMVYDFLTINPNVEIELAGHTDNGGKAKLNLKLSHDRVIRVKNYLVEKGIDARRIRGVGYGETMPIASNKTESGRRLNRRVEFKIISIK
jgi:outer membrane protein OmpA-like peptidoglycan-associated protein